MTESTTFPPRRIDANFKLTYLASPGSNVSESCEILRQIRSKILIRLGETVPRISVKQIPLQEKVSRKCKHKRTSGDGGRVDGAKLTGKPSVTRRDDIDDDDGELGKAEEGKIERERERDEGRGSTGTSPEQS